MTVSIEMHLWFSHLVGHVLDPGLARPVESSASIFFNVSARSRTEVVRVVPALVPDRDVRINVPVDLEPAELPSLDIGTGKHENIWCGIVGARKSRQFPPWWSLEALLLRSIALDHSLTPEVAISIRETILVGIATSCLLLIYMLPATLTSTRTRTSP